VRNILGSVEIPGNSIDFPHYSYDVLTTILRKSALMHQKSQAPSENIYIPAITVNQATFRHSLSRVQIAVLQAPERICGIAQRVGYTGSQDKDLAMYRLKVKAGNDLPTITLPAFFVIENGVFVDYEQWCQDKEARRV
jgi:hypothetical protein